MAQLFKKYFAERNTREYKNEYSSRARIELNEIIMIAKNILNRKYENKTEDNEHIKLINNCKILAYKNMIKTFDNYNDCFEVSDDESDTESVRSI